MSQQIGDCFLSPRRDSYLLLESNRGYLLARQMFKTQHCGATRNNKLKNTCIPAVS